MSQYPAVLKYGKRDWGFNELRECLDIEFFNLRCHAGTCGNKITTWNCFSVYRTLVNLSDTPSNLHKFKEYLCRLAILLCCESVHQGWEDKICEKWMKILYAIGKKEGEYLQERKALQAQIELRRKMSKMNSALGNPPLVSRRPIPVIHCIRHAEAGNGNEIDWYNRDPELTPQGVKDCIALSKAFNRHDYITHLIVSPLSRTISTAIAAFGPAIEATNVKLTLVPEIQAVSSAFSCIGLPCAELKEKYQKFGDIFNFDFVGSKWMVKLDGPYACDQASVRKRVKEVLTWCRDGQDIDDDPDGRREIVLVTHQSVLKHLGHTWEVPLAGWTTWTFTESGKLYETAESKRRRHASDSVAVSPASSNSPAPLYTASNPRPPFSRVKYRPHLVVDRGDESFLSDIDDDEEEEEEDTYVDASGAPSPRHSKAKISKIN